MSSTNSKAVTPDTYTYTNGIYGMDAFFCVKCKAQRGMKTPTQTPQKEGVRTHAIAGTCSTCGSKLHAFVKESVWTQVGQLHTTTPAKTHEHTHHH